MSAMKSRWISKTNRLYILRALLRDGYLENKSYNQIAKLIHSRVHRSTIMRDLRRIKADEIRLQRTIEQIKKEAEKTSPTK